MENNKLVVDFIKVQQNLPKVKKEGQGNYGKYLKLDDIMPLALEVLNKNNFALIQSPSTIGDHPALKTTLVHTSGEKITSTMFLMLDKETAQGQGSAITYARRYSLASILGLVADEDDDGQKATDATTASNALPSQKQIDMAKDLMHQKGYEGVEAMAVCEELIGKKIPQTKKDYSELIDKLLKK